MTYDYPSNEATPVAPYTWVNASVYHILGEEPRQYPELAAKIMLGLNFYGYHYQQNQPRNAILANTYLKLLQEHKPSFIWEPQSREHYFYHAGQSEVQGVVFYPTLQSIQDRLELAKQLGLGVSIWEIGQGLDYFYDLF
eukprot:TRINITY_DN9316_c0_g2_i5.p1 TRINITY_DN9316_c0_g2~~TRINITY_DN9316_c0_g2_i5.p1  ORF type:complete len:139 (+),score=26.25 TRINITY_DN9316_c0_g2_i5:305-721(+)